MEIHLAVIVGLNYSQDHVAHLVDIRYAHRRHTVHKYNGPLRIYSGANYTTWINFDGWKVIDHT